MIRTDAGLAAHPVAQLATSPSYSSGSSARSRSSASAAPVSIDGAAGQHQDQRIDGVVGVGDRPAGHPAGVVGDDTAQRAGDLAGRVGTELAPEPGQPGVDLAHGGARTDPDPGAAVEDLDVPEVPAGVHQDPVGDRLPAQAGAAGPEGHRHPLGGRHGEQPADVGGVLGRDHGARGEREMRGVVAQGEPVGGPAADLTGDRGQRALAPQRQRRLGRVRAGRGSLTCSFCCRAGGGPRRAL